MVSAAEMKFWTGIVVSDADMVTYTDVAEQHLKYDGGDTLSGIVRIEALCYFIASRIANSRQEGKLSSETISGYSYAKNTSSSTSGYWYDLYRELLRGANIGVSGSSNYNSGKGCTRVDSDIVHIQWST